MDRSGLSEGRQVHGEIIKGGFEGDVFVRNGLIGMYCKVGKMGFSRVLFEGFSGKDLVSWNLMLNGYVRCRDMGNAEKLFDGMPERDVVSWSVMIDGYKKMGDVAHARVLFDSMPSRDLISWNSIIDAYVKAGDMQSAYELFDDMDEKNVISWSIIIDGYVKHGNPKKSLDIFRQMLCQGVKPDKISIAGAVSACALLGALDQGRWIHMYTKKNKIMVDIVVQTALMDMYMKCGRVEEATLIFSDMKETNVVTWNVLISGLGMNGYGKAALDCFMQMEMTGIPMDDLIFVSALTACSHAGLIVEGLDIFCQMEAWGIDPKIEHYGCLVDLLGRAGQLDKAISIIDSMPMKQNAELWGSLLLACRIHHNVVLAEVVLERLKELKADDCGVYILMSNIYADVGKWEGVGRARKKLTTEL
nr:PREDICTED: pentatricopeptide repeat-containing protein At3g29230-like [Daucus carota subsp. sativus]